MLESLFLESTDTIITLSNLLAVMGAALGLGFLNSLVYIKTSRQKMPSQSFAVTLIMLPAVITVIILLVSNNVARAFSLAGAFSIIRFRSVPGDPKDMTYVLFSMAIGLACGMGYIAYAAIIAVILYTVMVILEFSGYGQSKAEDKLLKITIPENLDYQNVFDDVMEKYTLSHALTRVKTTDLGSLFELAYRVSFKNGMNEKEFIDELRCRNGNLNISLILQSSKSETEAGL